LNRPGTGYGIFFCKQCPHISQTLKLTKHRCAGCAGAAAAYPLQSWIFAQLLTVITLPNELLAHASAHWALMFFILGLGAGVAYFTLGWSSTTISTVGFPFSKDSPCGKLKIFPTKLILRNKLTFTAHLLYIPTTIL
jgi:hypothetical protein